jgi:UDP-N-acetylmuramate dehydrogenase
MEIQQNLSLAPWTTLGIGGPAQFFAQAQSEDDLLDALAFANARGLPVFILGGGSNLLVADSGYPGLVIRIEIQGPIVRREHAFHVPAGTPWDHFVTHICTLGLSGIECLAGIPGLTGGAPIQNIGAYGQEVAQTIASVRAYDRLERQFVTLDRTACRFAYRESLFNTTARGRYVVTEVAFTFDPAARPNLTYADLRSFAAAIEHPPTPLEVAETVKVIRHRKGMLLVPGEPDCRSAGSFFKNPIVAPESVDRIAATLGVPAESVPRYPAPHGRIKLPAAWLLEKAGFHKGYVFGEAGISSRHTLALINRGHATFADIVHLRELIVGSVLDRFGIALEQEPVEP